MGDAHEIYDSLKVCSQLHRAEKRSDSPKALKKKGINFEVKNNGAHLIITGKSVVVDFWPGTGKWIARKTGSKGYGLISLLRLDGIQP